MPIVSPCYPVCNSAPYVTQSTLRVMKREFARGNKENGKMYLLRNHSDVDALYSENDRKSSFHKC